MKKGIAFSPEFLSQLRKCVGYVTFFDSMFPNGFFDFSSCSANFLFLLHFFLRHFFALLLCTTSRWFSFDRPTSFMLYDMSISTTDCKLKRRGFHGYPDLLIREFIFSLAFLFRLSFDSVSRFLTAFFNGLLFSTSFITLLPAHKASLLAAYAPLVR